MNASQKLAWQITPDYDYSEIKFQLVDLFYKIKMKDGVGSDLALREAQNEIDTMDPHDLVDEYKESIGEPPIVDETPSFNPLDPFPSTLSWQIQDARPIELTEAEIGDIVVWKRESDIYGASVKVVKGDMGVVVGKDFEHGALSVEFYNKLTFRQVSPELGSAHSGWSVGVEDVDVYRKMDKDFIPIGNYKTSSQRQPIFICLWVPDEIKEKLSNVKDLDKELHVTLTYTPETEQTPEKQKELLQKIIEIAKEYKEIEVEFGGTAQFNNDDKSDVALVNIVEGPALYTKLINAIEEVYGKWEREFGFTPHMTLRAEGTGEVTEIEKFAWNAKHIGVTFGNTKAPDSRIFKSVIEFGTGKLEETLESKAWQLQVDDERDLAG